MKITLVTIGKTENNFLKEGIDIYLKRLKHYINFSIIEIPAVKKSASLAPEIIKEKEAELITKHISKADCIVLLDEKGKEMSSTEFSKFLQKKMNTGIRELIFVVGGAWGFNESLKKTAHHTLSLSRLTFSHQMVRLFFVEQLYRAFTIMKGESYHNE
ncbi:MAG: 23S rRNA (pseudouridine(1915)-N(3))-methyltransferase RlmH [Bacteroidales bacterium]